MSKPLFAPLFATGSLLLSCLPFSPAALAQTIEPEKVSIEVKKGPLSLRDILFLTLHNDQRIEAARFSVKMAREDVNDARSYFRPKVSGIGNISYNDVPSVNFFGNAAQDGLNVYGGVEVNQEVISFGRYGSKMRQNKAGVAQSQHELAITENDVLMEAIRAYLNYSRTLKARAAYQGYADDMSELLKRTKAKFDNQLIGRSEYLLVKSRLQQARASVSNNENEITRAFQRLAKLINMRSYQVVNEPTALYSAFLPRSLDGAITEAMEQDPRIKASQAQVTFKEEAARFIRADARPKLSLRAGYTRGKIDGRTTGEAIVGMNFQLPIYDGGSTKARTRRAKSDAARAKTMMREEQASTEEKVTAAWKIYQAFGDNEKSWQQALEAEREAVIEIQKEVDSQIRSLMVLLEAREQLMQAEINNNFAHFNRLLAGYELLVAAGKLNFLMDPTGQ